MDALYGSILGDEGDAVLESVGRAADSNAGAVADDRPGARSGAVDPVQKLLLALTT